MPLRLLRMGNNLNWPPISARSSVPVRIRLWPIEVTFTSTVVGNEKQVMIRCPDFPSAQNSV